LIYSLKKKELQRQIEIPHTNPIIGEILTANFFVINGLIYVQNSISKFSIDPSSEGEEKKY